MGANQESLTISGVAHAAGVNVETVRFYQRKGLLREPSRAGTGIRRYRQADVLRLQFIRSAQRLGFSLAEVSELLRLEDGTHCLEAMSLAERKLAEVHAKLTDLTRLERTLAKLVRACRARKGTLSCPLIASLHGKHNFAETAPSSAPPTASSCR